MSIDYETRDHIAYITINNPDRANVLDRRHSNELSEAWKQVWEDREVRVAIITGAGDRHFCAGHDISPREGVTAEQSEFLRTQRIFWPPAGTVNGATTGVDGRMGDHYPQIWKPVIAAINGWAAGAGLYLTLASTDIRLACAEHGRFKFALLSQGWVGAGPGATLLTRQIPYVDAMRMLLSDEPIDAEEAARIRLINEAVPHDDLMTRAEEIARQIVGMPPVAVRMMKEFVIRYRDVPFDQAWQVQHMMNDMLIHMTTDGEEGRRAFNEKRPPDFTGRLRRRGEPFPEPSPEEWERLEEIRAGDDF